MSPRATKCSRPSKVVAAIRRQARASLANGQYCGGTQATSKPSSRLGKASSKFAEGRSWPARMRQPLGNCEARENGSLPRRWMSRKQRDRCPIANSRRRSRKVGGGRLAEANSASSEASSLSSRESYPNGSIERPSTSPSPSTLTPESTASSSTSPTPSPSSSPSPSPSPSPLLSPVMSGPETARKKSRPDPEPEPKLGSRPRPLKGKLLLEQQSRRSAAKQGVRPRDRIRRRRQEKEREGCPNGARLSKSSWEKSIAEDPESSNIIGTTATTTIATATSTIATTTTTTTTATATTTTIATAIATTTTTTTTTTSSSITAATPEDFAVSSSSRSSEKTRAECEQEAAAAAAAVVTGVENGGDQVQRVPPPTLESLRVALENYDRSRIYLAHVCFLDWRDLPGRRPSLSGSGPDDGERVWVVGAADHEGHHRTRLLVAGRHWRPHCLRKVNMLSQPVVYAGGGRGSLTTDLFLWWFHREFAVTAMAMHPDGAVLVAEMAEYLPPEMDCVAADGLVRLFIVPKDCLEVKIVTRELRVRLAIGILSRFCCDSNLHRPDKKTLSCSSVPTTTTSHSEEVNDRLSVCLRKFTLKEAFVDLHRSWLSIRPETFSRSWVLPQERDDQRQVNSEMVPALSTRCHASSQDREDDRILLIELRTLARDAGLMIDDRDLNKWIIDEESDSARRGKRDDPEEDSCKTVKIEPEEKWAESAQDDGRKEERKHEDRKEDKDESEEDEEVPTAAEAVDLLSKVLTWMEREPLDPGLLLAVRSMRDTAALMASKMGLAGTHPSGLPFFCPNGDHLAQPPPAHMGIPPYGTLDAGKAAAAAGEYWPSEASNHDHHPSTHPAHWKRLLVAAASTGLTRAPMYPFSTGQYPYPMLSPEMTQVAASWHTPSMYPISPASAGFRSPYPTSLPITSSSLPSDLYRFSPTSLMPPHPGLSPHAHALASHALVSSAPKADHSTLDHNHRSTIEQKNSTSLPTDNSKNQDTGQQNNQDKKKPHIKKPLNAFMLYMKEMRAKVVAECTLKESAAINQILGRRWHALGREEQAKYYELARRERQLHMQLYPDWSSRANTNRTKKRKRKQDTNSDPGGNNMKKCRARYGLDQQSQWCKPCRRKKKCIRYMGEGGEGDGEADGEGEDDHSEDNLGSVGEAGTPEEDESLSSPGGLSALSSLASPSLVLPSPSSLASPCPCPLTPPVVAPTSSHSSGNSQSHGQPVTVQPAPQPPHRNPVGTNPHDINNPLSVNQLTGQCIKSEVGSAPSGPSNSAISVT